MAEVRVVLRVVDVCVKCGISGPEYRSDPCPDGGLHQTGDRVTFTIYPRPREPRRPRPEQASVSAGRMARFNARPGG